MQQHFRVKRRPAGEQFVKQHAQAVNVAARVNVQPAHLRLLRTHVGRRADELFVGGEKRLVGQFAFDGLGDAEINHLRHRHAVVQRHQNVRRLDVAVNDPLLVRVLDGVANLDEQIQPLAGVEMVLVAVVGDFDAAHQFHDKVRPPGFRRARVQHPGDVRMIHHRQRLPLGLETGDDALGVHAQLDDLEGDPAQDRLLLLGHIDHAAAAFADFLQQLVTVNAAARDLRSARTLRAGILVPVAAVPGGRILRCPAAACWRTVRFR